MGATPRFPSVLKTWDMVSAGTKPGPAVYRIARRLMNKATGLANWTAILSY